MSYSCFALLLGIIVMVYKYLRMSIAGIRTSGQLSGLVAAGGISMALAPVTQTAETG
jgi:hypothetical protein